GGGDAEIEAGDIERQHPASNCEGNSSQRQKGVAQVIEQAVEHPANQHEADRYNDIQTFLRFLKVSEFAGPNQPVSRRKFHVVRNPLLRLLDRAAQVAPTDAELDRD